MRKSRYWWRQYTDWHRAAAKPIFLLMGLAAAGAVGLAGVEAVPIAVSNALIAVVALCGVAAMWCLWSSRRPDRWWSAYQLGWFQFNPAE